ncbi:MAG: hypothetical protein MJ252_03390 [archaeon]|nr:hypothetical protein [archaeon]
MGVCQTKDRVKNQGSDDDQRDSNEIVINNLQNETPEEESKEIKEPLETIEDSKFADMPTWEGDKYTGYGIKRMKAYKCNMNINDLFKLRGDFWVSRPKMSETWKIIHQACVYDHEKAEEFLNKNKVKVVDGCINRCIDSHGKLFKVPNFCINLPYFEKELLEDNGRKGNLITIKLLDLCNLRKTTLKVSEGTKGIEIMNKFAEEHKINLNTHKIRLLFGGGLIKENETLYQHKVKDGYNIQISVSPIL